MYFKILDAIFNGIKKIFNKSYTSHPLKKLFKNIFKSIQENLIKQYCPFTGLEDSVL